MTTSLKKLLSIENVEDYKVHLAIASKGEYPLDVFVYNRNTWKVWQTHGTRNDYNKKYIFSLMQFKNAKESQPTHWLFGGIFEVKDRFPDSVKSPSGYQEYYDVNLTDQWSDLIGRLKGCYHNNSPRAVRQVGATLDQITLLEILPTPYTG